MPISTSLRGKPLDMPVAANGFERQATKVDREALLEDLAETSSPKPRSTDIQKKQLRALGIHAWTDKAEDSFCASI